MKFLAPNGWYIVFVYAIFLALNLAGAEFTCPPISENNNCSCYVFEEEVFLECPGTTLANLQKVLSTFVGIPIKSLSIYDLDRSVATIKADVFNKNVVIRQVKISLSNLNQLTEDSFKHLKNSLQSLGIISGKLAAVPQKALMPLTGLQSITFESNEIKELPSYCFYGLRLTQVNLKGNVLHKISEYAFAGLEDSLLEMDLSENKLKNFPILAIRRLERLKDLKLAWNEISYIPDDGYSSIKSILRLDLSSNNFVSVSEDAFRPLPFVRTLSLYYNAIEGIHRNAFISLIDLESIDLSHNKIVFLDAVTFQNNLRIKTIDLSHNHVHYISGVFANLPELRELFLSENNILDVTSDAFANSNAVAVVYLQQNAIRQIDPGAFSSLSNLTHLHLSENFIESLPRELFQNCTELESLNLDNNLINAISPGLFSNTVKLKELRFHNNRIRAIQKGIFETLPELLELHLQNNLISDIEAGSLSTMVNLQHVNLQGNLLRKLGDVFLHQSSSLISIQLDSNGLSSFHNESLKGQSNVQIMWLGHNKLTKLDRALFSDLLLIQRVYFTNNSISVIEDGTFEPMAMLALLDLSFNELKSISKNTFAELSNLEELYLASNRIQNVDGNSFATLKKLRVLDLSNNKLVVLHKSIFQSNLPIERLRLENCSVATIEEGVFYSLNKLRNLDLRRNYLDADGVSKIQIPLLRVLNLSFNNISKLFEVSLKGIPSVRELFLDNNGLLSLEEKVFAKNTQLSSLSMKENHLKAFNPDIFEPLAALKELRLDKNKMVTFPYLAISNAATSLKVLSMSRNNFTSVDFSKFTNVKDLSEMDLSENLINYITGFTKSNFSRLLTVNLNSNMLSALPANFFQTATSLKILNLSANRFRHIPSISISGQNLPNLKSLNLTKNPLSQIHDVTSIKQYPALEEVHITGTTLSVITSKDFEAFPSLLHLFLSDNKIGKISPSAFRSLPNLLTLDFGGNQLEIMPQERLQGLTQLRLLNLTRNYIHFLEQLHTDLKALQILDLSHNRIEKIERDTFRNLDNLAELHLYGNMISIVSADAFRPLKKLRLLDLSRNDLENLPLNAFRPLETQIRSLRTEGKMNSKHTKSSKRSICAGTLRRSMGIATSIGTSSDECDNNSRRIQSYGSRTCTSRTVREDTPLLPVSCSDHDLSSRKIEHGNGALMNEVSVDKESTSDSVQKHRGRKLTCRRRLSFPDEQLERNRTKTVETKAKETPPLRRSLRLMNNQEEDTENGSEHKCKVLNGKPRKEKVSNKGGETGQKINRTCSGKNKITFVLKQSDKVEVEKRDSERCTEVGGRSKDERPIKNETDKKKISKRNSGICSIENSEVNIVNTKTLGDPTLFKLENEVMKQQVPKMKSKGRKRTFADLDELETDIEETISRRITRNSAKRLKRLKLDNSTMSEEVEGKQDDSEQDLKEKDYLQFSDDIEEIVCEEVAYKTFDQKKHKKKNTGRRFKFRANSGEELRNSVTLCPMKTQDNWNNYSKNVDLHIKNRWRSNDNSLNITENLEPEELGESEKLKRKFQESYKEELLIKDLVDESKDEYSNLDGIDFLFPEDLYSKIEAQISKLGDKFDWSDTEYTSDHRIKEEYDGQVENYKYTEEDDFLTTIEDSTFEELIKLDSEDSTFEELIKLDSEEATVSSKTDVNNNELTLDRHTSNDHDHTQHHIGVGGEVSKNVENSINDKVPVKDEFSPTEVEELEQSIEDMEYDWTQLLSQIRENGIKIQDEVEKNNNQDENIATDDQNRMLPTTRSSVSSGNDSDFSETTCLKHEKDDDWLYDSSISDSLVEEDSCDFRVAKTDKILEKYIEGDVQGVHNGRNEGIVVQSKDQNTDPNAIILLKEDIKRNTSYIKRNIKAAVPKIYCRNRRDEWILKQYMYDLMSDSVVET